MNILYEKWISYIIIIVCSIFEIKMYNLISSQKKKVFTLKNFVIVVIISIIQLVINFNIFNRYKILLSYTLIFIQYKLVFCENNKLTIIKTLTINFIIALFEVVLSILVINVKILNFFIINEEIILFKNLFTILLILCTTLIFYIKYINKNIRNLINLIYNHKFKPLRVCLILLNILAISIMMQFATEINKSNYFLNIGFLIIVLILYFAVTLNYVKIEKLDERQKILINYISRYEKIIDKDRIMQHEILNNLLILRSFENKNSLEFNDFLIEMIKTYDNKELKKYSNISKLPLGIKGIFYYKLNEVEKYNINLTFYYSSNLDYTWKKIPNKEFIRLCKIVGIFLDNAIEASISSDKKALIIDIYKQEKNLIIYIENSTNKKLTLNKIIQKNYSTKENHKGLGLYIAYKLKKESNNIKISQKSFEDKFITNIKVKI